MRLAQEIITEARETVLHGDAGPAWRCLKELAELERDSAGTLPPEITTLKTDLRYTAFPVLTLEEATTILGTEINSLLARGIDLDDRLSVRYAFTDYGDHERERQVMQKAILGNQEMIAGKAIGTWLHEFDKAFKPETREEQSIFDFLNTNRQLPERERMMLRIILSAYENWLATERLNIFDLAYLKQHPELAAQGEVDQSSGPYASAAANQAYQSIRSGANQPGKGILKLALLKAIGEYPRLGEQMITAEKIRVKGQPEPVRPTLANWIRYYRDELGIGFHDQVMRGRLLFQSENGKKLSSEEREHINLILKSLEEDYPLDIDTDRNQILFPPVTTGRNVSGGQPQFRPTPATASRPVKPFQPIPFESVATSPLPKSAFLGTPKETTPSFLSGTFGAAKNIAGDTLHFSTGHVLSAEKERAVTEAAPERALTPEVPVPPATPITATPTFNMSSINRNRGSALPRSPYSIRPLRLRDDQTEEEK